MNILNITKVLAISAAVVFSMATTADTIKLKMATDTGSKGSPTGDALDNWAKLIQQKTAGTPDEIKINIFYQ
ncbi:MAG: hypothetical protein KBT66_09385, partial [Amphritea sp.]|nr:hypothetical protein [Amphritea sp.]